VIAASAEAKPKWQAEGVDSLNRCGPVALQVCAAVLERPIASAVLEEHLPVRQSLYNLAEIRDAAHALGLNTLAVRWTSLYPRFPVAPAILPIVFRGHPHFVVLTDSCLGQLRIIDVAHVAEPVWVTESHLREHMQWDGTALHVGKDQRFLTIHAWVYGPWIVAGIVLLLSVKAVHRRRAKGHALSDAAVAVPLLVIAIAGCTGKHDEIYFDPKLIVAEQQEDHPSGTYRCSLVNDTSNPVSVRSLRTSCSCVRIEAPSADAIAGGNKCEFVLHVDYPFIGKREVDILAECVTSSAGSSDSDVRYSTNAKVIASANLSRLPRVEWATPHLELIVDRPGVTQAIIEAQTMERADSSAWFVGLQIADEDGHPMGRADTRVVESRTQKEAGLCRRRYKCVLQLDRSRLRDVKGQLYATPEVPHDAQKRSTIATIAVHVKSPFRVTPAVVVLQSSDHRSQKPAVVIDYDSDLPYRVHRAEFSFNSGNVEVGQRVEDARGLTQTVSWDVDWNALVDPGVDSPEQLHKLILHTDHPWYRSITVPVMVQKASQQTTGMPDRAAPGV
jgi:hypothetical protein